MGKVTSTFDNAPDDDKPDYELDTKEKIAKMVDRVSGWFDYFNNNIENARDDKYFLYINQWDQELYALRLQQNKACLQINRAYAIVCSIIGQFRKQTPEFKIFANSSETNPHVKIDQNMIDLYDNLMRQIFFDNKSEVVFQTTFDEILSGGFGAMFVHSEYESETSFNQKIVFKAEDPFCAFFDPNALDPCKQDGNYCGYAKRYTIADFKAKWPDSKASLQKRTPQSFQFSEQYKQYFSYWRGDDFVTVVNAYVREKKPIKAALLSDGRSMRLDLAKEEVEKFKSLKRSVVRKENMLKKMATTIGIPFNDESIFDEMETLSIVDTRDTTETVIMNYVMTHDEILEESEWPGKYLPGVFVDGHSQYIDGQQVTKSFIRTSIDSQRVYNYTISEAVENLMNCHKAMFLGTPENFEGHQYIWQNPSAFQGALVANRDDAGQLPAQLQPPQISPNFIQLQQQAALDINNTLGYYEENQGKESNAESGVAIHARNAQGSLANFVYFDNIGRGIDMVAKICMDLIPKIYDTSRKIVVRDENGEQKMVAINVPTADGYKNDLTQGSYGIEVTVGSNYELQKVQNLAQLKDLLSVLAPSNPAIVGVLADLYTANTDLENTTQMVERIRQFQLGMSPQEILAKEMGIDPSQLPKKTNPEEELKQMEIKVKQGELQVDQVQNEIDKQKLQIEVQKMQSEERIENQRAKAEMFNAIMDAKQAHMNYAADMAKAHAQMHASKMKGLGKVSQSDK
jgi:hypothetical protein